LDASTNVTDEVSRCDGHIMDSQSGIHCVI
jgi:hypothetical protein